VPRYAVLCDCAGSGYLRQLVAVVDDTRAAGRAVVVSGQQGFEAKFAPHEPNRHGKFLTYRLQCPQCPRYVLWAENTLFDVMDYLAPHRRSLEVVCLPAPPKTAAAIEMMRRLRPDDPTVQMMTDADVVTPGVQSVCGARYVIPVSELGPLVERFRKKKLRELP
jgi:hypothetical protein